MTLLPTLSARPEFYSIPSVGSEPAFKLDRKNRQQVTAFIERVEALFRLSANSWVRANDGLLSEEMRAFFDKRCDAKREQGEKLLAPLGFEISFPGLYPSFTVNGYCEHTVEAAVLAAVR